ncbi:DNA-directed RNA polymerase II subunit rpb1-like isoform X2 [Anthonomus grandis grandis]|uniref:DNA-directed RNA polymerase II subunit rpb1-like isoform X2 n=1 Tax=Anthonomus grandis grandis TaxID=2921223 RepID=UPI0021669CCC|nr:DNA-directed RNA polymerase II subunit rpb1-like isoform X2 [Anthonomus grandis grandis]
MKNFFQFLLVVLLSTLGADCGRPPLLAPSAIFRGGANAPSANFHADFSRGASAGSNGGPSVSVSFKGGLSLSGLIQSLLKLPINIGKFTLRTEYKLLLKAPFQLVSRSVTLLTNVLQGAENIQANVISQILALFQEVFAQLVDVLVNLGVLQGKTMEEIVSSLVGIFMKIINFFTSQENQISANIVDSIERIIGALRIREILARVSNAPIVREVVTLLLTIRNQIQTTYQSQIDELKYLLRTQFEQHKDFFQPLLDSISSRILIVTNALQALISGDLPDCPGKTDPSSLPTGSLQWQLNIWLQQFKVKLFKILGFSRLAAQSEEKLDEISTPPPPPAAATFDGTTPPPPPHLSSPEQDFDASDTPPAPPALIEQTTPAPTAPLGTTSATTPPSSSLSEQTTSAPAPSLEASSATPVAPTSSSEETTPAPTAPLEATSAAADVTTPPTSPLSEETTSAPAPSPEETTAALNGTTAAAPPEATAPAQTTVKTTHAPPGPVTIPSQAPTTPTP